MKRATQGRIDPQAMRALLAAAEPADAIQAAGYAVYAVDSTPQPRPEWNRSNGNDSS